MRTHGKKYTAAKGQVENKPYPLADALPLVQKIKFAKFDETVALSIRGWASTRSTPTRWCAAPSSSRTGSASSKKVCW